MISIPSQVTSSQPFEHNKFTQLQQRIKTLEAENRELKQQLLWEDKLFANPHLSPSHKLALRAAVSTVRKAKSEPEGLTKIFIPAIAEKAGLSAKTVGKNLQYLAETGAIIREAETETDQNGQKITRVSIGLTEAVKRPDQIIPPQPRNHGGYREHCPSCGSENLLEEKKIICTDCGTVIRTTQRFVNADPTDGHVDPRSEEEDQEAQTQATEQHTTQRDTQPTDNLTPLLKPKEPTDNLTSGVKPATPPESENCVLQETAALLLDIAGDHHEHIAMNANPQIEKKYLTVHKRLTLEDMKAHLAGTRTLGGRLSHTDGTTRALCFDADDETTWQQLKDSASLLIAVGYKPLLEPSPAGRGGHLWIIFSERVNASAAYSHVCTLAPALNDISEYWPSKGNQKVRLPAGKYTTPVFSDWCHLVDASGHEIQNLPLYQTPAQIIPDTPEPPTTTDHLANRDKQFVTIPEPVGVDHYWLQKYGKSNLWFAWTDEQLAAWYNSKTQVYDLLPPEKNGNGLAQWRGERTASVVFRDDTTWVDFGAGARRADGKQDGGDCLELKARIEERPKREVMSDIAKQLVSEARAALENAARNGEQVPAWIVPFLTDAGWNHYEQIAKQRGGVVGFIPTCPPPPRPCICCNAQAWKWTGEKYICSHPDHPREP